jgi:hypothetical protein
MNIRDKVIEEMKLLSSSERELFVFVGKLYFFFISYS